MEIKQYEYFLAVARCSSLTKAAELLYTTQPHVSMVIRSLEEELGVKLFRRKSKGVELTEDGLQIYSYVENVMKSMETIRNVSKEKTQTTLKIASNPSGNMATLITAYYDTLKKENIVLKFTECGIEQMMELMDKDRYDMGFIFAPVDRIYALNVKAREHHLEFVPLFYSDLVVHVSKDHPLYGLPSVSSRDLKDLDFIQLEEDYFTLGELLSESSQNNNQFSLKRVVSTNSDHMMIKMLKTGKVANLGSYWNKERFSEYGFSMVRLEGYEGKVAYGYLKHRNHPLRKAAEDFMTFFRKEVMESL